MNLQDISFPITLTIPEAELILAGLSNLPKKDADPIFAKVQQTALQKIQEVQTNVKEKLQEIQTNGAANPQVQADINQAEANSDSMKGE